MATFVRRATASTGSASSAAVSFGALPAVGNLIIVGITMQPGADLISAGSDCTDNQGHSYNLAIDLSQPTSFHQAAIFYTVVTTSSGTFTITLDPAIVGNFYSVITVEEWAPSSGTWVKASCLVGTSSASANSSTPSTGSATITGTTSLVAAAECGNGAAASITVQVVAPTWTESHETLNMVFSFSGHGEFNTRAITPTSSAQSCSWTLGGSTLNVGVIAAFSETPAATAIARLSQIAAEILVQTTEVVPARLSQIAAEVLVQTTEIVPARLSQIGAEILVQDIPVVTSIQRVQGTARQSTSNSTTATHTFATRPTLGNGLIVFVNAWRNPAPTSFISISDNNGNSYTLATSRSNSNVGTAIFYCPILTSVAVGASFIITITSTSNQYWIHQAVEYTNIGTGLLLDKFTNASGTSATPATGSTAALTANEVIHAAVFATPQPQSTINVGNPTTPWWTQEFEELPFNFVVGEGDSKITTGMLGLTTSANWVNTSSGIWAAAIATFMATGIVPPVTDEQIQSVMILL